MMADKPRKEPTVESLLANSGTLVPGRVFPVTGPMVICGGHVIDASNVAYLQQVNTQHGRAFTVVAKFGRTNYPLFLSADDIKPLLDFWGLDASQIKPVAHLTSAPRHSRQPRDDGEKW
jgi:hypothetical protein